MNQNLRSGQKLSNFVCPDMRGVGTQIDSAFERWNNRGAILKNCSSSEYRRPPTPEVAAQRSSKALLAAGAAILVLFAVGLYLIVNLRDRVKTLEATVERQSRETKVIEKKLFTAGQNVEAGMQQLDSRVG